jgi:hypothetical protein
MFVLASGHVLNEVNVTWIDGQRRMAYFTNDDSIEIPEENWPALMKLWATPEAIVSMLEAQAQARAQQYANGRVLVPQVQVGPKIMR